jgi:hypothetical protein
MALLTALYDRRFFQLPMLQGMIDAATGLSVDANYGWCGHATGQVSDPARAVPARHLKSLATYATTRGHCYGFHEET